MKAQLIIIRGVSGSGKSTIAEKLRKHFPKKTAVIHTEMFYWGIVNGDKPETVMENTRRIVDNYLKNDYTVILEGTLSFRDKKGNLYINKCKKLAKKYNVKLKQFFLFAEMNELKKREKVRRKISLKLLSERYKLCMGTINKNEVFIDTTKKTISEVLKEIKKEI